VQAQPTLTTPGHETRRLETKSRDSSAKGSRRLEIFRQKSRESLETFNENFSLVVSCRYMLETALIQWDTR